MIRKASAFNIGRVKENRLNTKHYDRYEIVYIVAFWTTTSFVSAWLNAESVIDDHQRANLSTQSWEIYTWEFSSHLVSLLLIPLVIWLNRCFPLTSQRLGRAISIHLVISVFYSLIHVVGMVLIRKVVYQSMNSSYDFGNWGAELIYEYRKDGYAYAELILILYCYSFIISRLRGEAKMISEGEDAKETESTRRILVKKIGKEFILKTEDIDWIEAAGNYMNLHSKDRIYPIRETMANLQRKLDPNLFARIHRSTMVNIDRIKQIEPLDSGDFQLELSDGKILKLSRRYRESIKKAL